MSSGASVVQSLCVGETSTHGIPGWTKTLLPYLDRSYDAPATANVLAFKKTSISFIEDGDFRWVSEFIRISGCWLVARILVNNNLCSGKIRRTNSS